MRRTGGAVAALPEGQLWQLDPPAFRMRVQPDSMLGYAQGEGIIVDRGEQTHAQEIDLFCEGTMAAAVTALNGLYPFHASTVLGPRGAVMLAGTSGAGKSTLAAALALSGWPLLADDLSILLPHEGRQHVLPWRKRLKLWPDIIEALGLAAGPMVSPEYPKHFVDVPRADTAAPLSALVILADGLAGLCAASAGEAMAAWTQEHYSSALLAAARGWTAADRFKDAAEKVAACPAFVFTRPVEHTGPQEAAAMLRMGLEEAVR
ncbi:hypothetical protein [Paraurantiacibacter namhicola]|nr:hypothetical protein [Paraurantiacibacter namhicola]